MGLPIQNRIDIISTLSCENVTKEILRDFLVCAREAEDPNLLKIVLYGSQARGDDTPDSDIRT